MILVGKMPPVFPQEVWNGLWPKKSKDYLEWEGGGVGLEMNVRGKRKG